MSDQLPAWQNMTFQARLVNIYRDHCVLTWGDALPPDVVVAPVEPPEARLPYEECVAKLGYLLTISEGRVALRVPAPSDEATDQQRHMGGYYTERLNILFNPALTVSEVAKKQMRTGRDVHETLRNSFRTLAVVEHLQPQLLASLPRPLPPNPVESRLRVHMEALSVEEREVVTAVHGLFGCKPQTIAAIARRQDRSVHKLRKIFASGMRRLTEQA